MPRTRIYTEEEIKERRREWARIYQQKRYRNDKEFREKRKAHSAKTYEDNKAKLQEKTIRLEELEKLLKETKLK